ncbi:MAG: NifU family protein [Planctomycetota bacterium]|nr:MAG: NifU family protein [Planctomycetota bacterium]
MVSQVPDNIPSVPQDLAERIGKVIEAIRPAIQADGGDIEFVEAKSDGAVYIRFHGACVGCPSSDMTLNLGIERNLRQHVPEVRRVIVVE